MRATLRAKAKTKSKKQKAIVNKKQNITYTMTASRTVKAKLTRPQSFPESPTRSRTNSVRSTGSTSSRTSSTGASIFDESMESMTSSGQFVTKTKEVGRIILSPHSLTRGRKVDSNTANLITEDHLQMIVKTSKAIYMDGSKQALFRSPSKTRKIVCENIEPYLEDVNKQFAELETPVCIVVDSVYSNFASSHPTYFLSVRTVS
uniref:Uncharacterized protein n=1 Tax=Mucochytrium quahogii TaxID=96639 RepID=A0A7S2S5R5_9STRA|mmetsp:Transcript_21531/g.34988  ORF Transcript_21531/g.34988 Transcript_21531/m.34988 type:complete len:204 (+) Transcript_21531:110-721(+)|eukprot:CAMPEP_0203759022 /NCGR_PEP_ID=MMETSP0098-20131031/11955_1 /ASSEMBLY_ACC=CAM_ASM_000208 /TAXON_ID=96639 /ORGANISM=" , Strain NY0313808BC1" /LENGTH=203 /DNA_ID=CAMNT_0050651749 /DNA_START=42 /DNA_END=653 /DNA_ORIENTATION=+